jgi:chromate transporter
MDRKVAATDAELAALSAAGATTVSFGEATRLWAKIGLLGFGGPAGQIALMHRLLVDEKRWIGEQRFLHALNYCMLLPGPEAQQLATYIGWLLHRTAGGLVAGTLFVLPGFFVMLALSAVYAGFQHVPLVQALFFGIKPAVLAIVLHAVVRIGKRALVNRFMVGLAAAAFIGIFLLRVPFPLIVLGAGALGYLAARLGGGSLFVAADRSSPTGDDDAVVDRMFAEGVPDHVRASPGRTLGVLAIWLPLWLFPVALLMLWLGGDHVLAQIGLFFSKMAVVTFGGAYAVLAYVAQQAVEGYGWLKPGEMLDGLGMAETTPGPLILVLEYVGFMAAYRQPGPLAPMLAGALGAALTVWVTFTPCFLWIFLGAPYVERLRANRALAAALSAITAAVVGVILNLAVWFALHTIFGELHEVSFAGLALDIPVWSTLEQISLLLALGAVVAMFRFRVGMLPTLAVAALLGGAIHLLA